MLTLPHTIDQDFAYALGRLGSLESQLLEQTDVDRLLGASSGEEAVKMLRDIDFIEVPEGAEGFQEVLDTTAGKIKENVERMVPEEKHFIFDVLWLDGSRVNIAYAAKEEHGFVSNLATPPNPPVTAGLNLEEMLAADFSPHSGHYLVRSTPQTIDNEIAEKCKKCAIELARDSGSAAISAYVERMIEIEESRNAIRNPQSAIRMDAVVFEQESIASIRELLEDMKRMFLGPEPVFSYAARAMNHLALLRVLLTGKVNDLEIQEIKSLLPPLL